jgi:RNA polymerase II subunit A small phosphatase-like protein
MEDFDFAPIPTAYPSPPIPSTPVSRPANLFLPPPAKADQDKICLVLDLDETLVHSSLHPHPHHEFSFSFGPPSMEVSAFVLVRPGARELLRALGPLYELVIFTAGLAPYADRVIDELDSEHNVKFRLFREDCTDLGGKWVKDLDKMNRDIERLIIVDNSPAAYTRHPYNAIPIESWFEEPGDQALFTLVELLNVCYRLRNVYDVLCFS